MKLSENTILIAGATSGIGLELARRPAAEGNTVIAAGRRRVREDTAIQTVQLDVTSADSITAVTRQLTAQYPGLNVLITMAGIMLPEDLHHSGFLATAEATVETNLLGTIRLIAALTEHLTTRPRATIVTVSSGLAFVPLPITPTYNATKAAVHSFTESLRVQLSDTSIDVLELVPPAIRTTLMNQENNEQALPVSTYLDQVMSALAARGTGEILVPAVEPLRFAEARGEYASMLNFLASLPDGAEQ
jgi:uncharacterized oxidoreductase